MSLTTEVTVHCDTCGVWEHTDAAGSVAATARDRIRRGWVKTTDKYGKRRDQCPDCVRRAASPAASGRDTPNDNDPRRNA